jgi:hypothetical protein
MIKRAQLESVLFKHSQVPGVPTVSDLPNQDPNGEFNPINIGLKLGLAGAGAGLGFAALRTLIRRARGQNIMPGTSVKDVMIGALIGSTVGMGGAHIANKVNKTMHDNAIKDFEDLVNKRMGKGPEVQAAPMLKTDSLGLPGQSGYKKIANVMSPALLTSILYPPMSKCALVYKGLAEDPHGMRDVYDRAQAAQNRSGAWGTAKACSILIQPPH